MGMEEATSRRATASWPSFLRGDDSRSILARLSESDPLRLKELSARRLREVWILLDPDRVHARASAVCAIAAPREPPAADLAAWSRAKVDVAIDQLVQSDREAERAHPETSTEEERKFPLLTDSLMIEAGLVRAATVAFNALGELPRRAFFELLIEGKQVPECIEAGPWDEDGLYDAIQEALAPFGLDVKPESAEDTGEEET